MAASPAPSRRSWVVNAVGIALAFGLLALAIYQNRVELARVFARHVEYRLFGVGLLIYMTSLMMTFGRWYLLVRAQAVPLRLRDAFRLGFIGNVFNLVIPGAVGGDFIKAAYLSRMHPDRRAAAWASMILDRFLGLLGLFVLAGVAGAVTWSGANPQVRTLILLVWLAVLAGFVGLGVAFSPALYRPLNHLVRNRGRLKTLVRRLEAIGLAYRTHLATVALMLVTATASHALFVIAFYSASAAIFDQMPSLGQHYLMVPLTLFTTAVPLPFGALGLSEQISGQLFAMVNHRDGAVAMMAFRVLMYASGVLSALVYLGNLRQVRTLQAEAEAEQAEENPLDAEADRNIKEPPLAAEPV